MRYQLPLNTVNGLFRFGFSSQVPVIKKIHQRICHKEVNMKT